MTPEPATKSSLFPRFGSKYRYSGRTHYETKKMPLDREQPRFERSLTGKRISSRSMDGELWGECGRIRRFGENWEGMGLKQARRVLMALVQFEEDWKD
jgi:erythrocyte membrane protein band 4.1